MAKKRSAFGEVVRIVLPLLITAAGVGGFILLSKTRDIPVRAAEKDLPPLVETVAAETYTGSLDITVDGVVVPYREVDLSAEVAGRIVKKAAECEAGHFVKQGTLLFEVDPSDYELEIRRLQEELNQAEVAIEEADVEVENTKGLIELSEEDLELQRLELQRTQGLAGRSAVTESEFDRVKRSELSARNALRLLRNQLQISQTRRRRQERAKELVVAQLDRARLDLKRTAVRAPFDGVIVRESAEKDSYVQKGTSLVTVEDTSAVEIRCSLRVEELYWLWQQSDGDVESTDLGASYRIPPTPVTVIYSVAGRQYTWDGNLSRYDGIGFDEQTRTIPCRVVVSNPRDVKDLGATEGSVQIRGPQALVRGMYVTIKLHAQPRVKLLSIPERALRPGNVVWFISGESLRIEPVHVAETLDDVVLLHGDTSKLASGDAVVVSPLTFARDGMAVRENTQPSEQGQL